FPQSVTTEENSIKLPKIGLVKAVFDRRYEGTIKTVTITKDSSDKYFASVVYELEACFISGNGDKIIGLDLGIKDFCIAHDGTKTSKYANPRHLKKHEKNLARKQQKLARKQIGSKSRQKAKKLVAKVHARISNARQDFLHKLSRKLTNESQVIVVENLFLNGSLMEETTPVPITGGTPATDWLPKTAPVRNVRGMVRNHPPALSRTPLNKGGWGGSDAGWGMFVNFLSYKLERENKRLVEIDRFFPSSHICPDCLTQTPKMDLSIRKWTCLNESCGKTHDRDEAASRNIRAEGIRIIKTDGTAVSASGGSVRSNRGRKTKVRQHPAKLETPSS
ncbi:MAG: RNA-guided endonuclease InsQ/TnpB family protein, partial [Waterburya sp.]